MKPLKRRLADKDLTIGSWLSFPYPQTCEMMCRAGFDFLVVDQEHGAMSPEKTLSLVQIIELSKIAPLVRVARNDPSMIAAALDLGAHGVIVPRVNSAVEARAAVAHAHYPPKGSRGAGLARAQAYGAGFSEYRARADRETVVVVQIEHIDAVRNLDAILAVDGVDGFMVGPYDLSASLGKPGELDAPEVRSALKAVDAAAKKSKKAGGVHVVHSNEKALRKRIAEGYSFIAYGDDMVFLTEKLQETRDLLSRKIR